MKRRDLPTPGQILEELADKTAAQIDRMAPVAFDDAWREMTRYHRFLLALNASRTPMGTVQLCRSGRVRFAPSAP